MISISKAYKIIDKESRPLGIQRIDLADAIGRVLAETVIADSDLPPFDRSQMDGYAVRAADTLDARADLVIVGESAAGRGWDGKLRSGEAVRIMTGARLPEGADAVQKVELATENSGHLKVHQATEAGRFIVKKGSEIERGKVGLKTGTKLTAGNISIPAAFGYSMLKVAKRPRVAILSTGSELVEISKKPKRDQIRNSNSLMLAALCREAGAVPLVFPNVDDDLSNLKSQISREAADSDLVITTGGVSVGKYDLTKLALAELGATIFFDKVALKPGKPTVFAKLKKTYVFGLAGNPVSAAVTFHLFVKRLIGHMQGELDPCLRDGLAIAGGRCKGTVGRDTYLPSKLSIDAEARLVATHIRWLGSSDLVGFAQADALLFIPHATNIEAAEIAKILFL